MTELTLYGREGCHLCEEARTVLVRLRSELSFHLVECDIDDDEALQRAYFDRIPVVTLDGREVCEYVVDEDALRVELAAAAPDPG